MNRRLRPPTVVSLPVRDGLRTIDLPLNQAYEGLESLARHDELSVVEDEPEDDSSELSVIFAGAHHSERPPPMDTLAAPPPSYPPASAGNAGHPYPPLYPPPLYPPPPSSLHQTGNFPAVVAPEPGALHARSAIPGPAVNPSGRPITLPPNVISVRPPPPPSKQVLAEVPPLPLLPPPHAADELLDEEQAQTISSEPPRRPRADSILDFDDEVDTTVMPSRFGSDTPSDRPPVDSLRPVALPSLPPPPVGFDASSYYGSGSREGGATIPAPPLFSLPPPLPAPPHLPPPPLSHLSTHQLTGPRAVAPARVVVRSEPHLPAFKRQRMPWLAAGGAIAGAALVAAVAFWPQKRGELVIDVADQQCGAVEDVQVYVDDELACTTSPCSVKVANGSHVVRAEAAGYAVAAPQAVLVDPDTPTLHKVQFGATTKTGIEVRGKVSGLTLYLDGKLVGELPKRVTGLSAGEHTILVTGGEGFYAEERKLDLKPDEMLVIGDLELKPRKGSLKIEGSEQLQGATVLLDGVPIRLPYEKELDASRRYHVQARRPGFEDFDTWIEFGGAERDKKLDIQLTPKQGGQQQGAPEPVPAPEADRSFAASAGPSEAPPRKSARSRSGGGDEATGQGRLNLVSDPPSMVVLDGKPMGLTPRVVSVSPGTHSVLFIHKDLGRARASAKVDAGQSKTLRARF